MLFKIGIVFFIIYFLFGCACFMCSLCLRAILTFLIHGLFFFFVEDRLASLVLCHRLIMAMESCKFEYCCYDET